MKSVEDADMHYLDFTAKFQGMLTKHLGLQISYDLDYFSERPQPLEKASQMVSAGVTVNY